MSVYVREIVVYAKNARCVSMWSVCTALRSQGLEASSIVDYSCNDDARAFLTSLGYGAPSVVVVLRKSDGSVEHMSGECLQQIKTLGTRYNFNQPCVARVIDGDPGLGFDL